MNSIEVYRGIIPYKKLINDNSGQHYRILSGKTQWLTGRAKHAVSGVEGPGGFVSPSKDEVGKVIDRGNFGLILEHWKCQRSFDLANYEMTFKPIIDVFSSNDYWEDDAWKFLCPVIFSGGDHSVWDERAIRHDGDNLPDNIRKEWWIDHGADPTKDSFIRIFAFDNSNIMSMIKNNT